MSLAWALVFGALISPTDPVAVLSTLKNVNVPANLEVEMQGESLFNDGVGIVLFTILLRFAAGDGETGAAAISELLVLEAGGGILLGLATGYLAYRAMRLIDDYPIEVLITLALVTGTYALAQQLHVSGPLSVVAAGLLIGDRGPRYAMSEQTQTYVFALWTLIDEILNSVLFLLIGLEVLVLRFEPWAVLAAAAAIPIVLVATIVRRGAAAAGVRLEQPDVGTQCAVPDLGRRPRRHIGRAGAVDSGERRQTLHPRGDLRGRTLQRHCPGLDPRRRGEANHPGGYSGQQALV